VIWGQESESISEGLLDKFARELSFDLGRFGTPVPAVDKETIRWLTDNVGSERDFVVGDKLVSVVYRRALYPKETCNPRFCWPHGFSCSKCGCSSRGCRLSKTDQPYVGWKIVTHGVSRAQPCRHPAAFKSCPTDPGDRFVVFPPNLDPWRGRAVADATSLGPWEVVCLITLNNNDGRLMAGEEVAMISHGHNGRDQQFITSLPEGVFAARKAISNWERMRIFKLGGDGQISYGDKVAVWSKASGKWWAAEQCNGGVNANRETIGPWETFRIRFL